MRRIVVVGQTNAPAALCPRQFARALALRLSAHHVTDDSPPALLGDEAWVAVERSGVFSETLFRQADTIVWLHFSPLPYLRDWLARTSDALRAAVGLRSGEPASRATWRDIRAAFDYLMIAPEMVALMRHPALAHARVIELRAPKQADFWLMMQRRRSGMAPLSGARGELSS